MKLKVAFFDFTGCEGCQLQKLNCEEEFLDILKNVEIVNFREATSIRRDDYDVAFVEGAVSTPQDVGRIQKIRDNAKILITLGACASTGGLNKLKNFQPLNEVRDYVYGDQAVYFDTIPVMAHDEIVKVDYKVHGCPMDKKDYMNILKSLILGTTPYIPDFPVCVECKRKGNICRYDIGEICLGIITRAGCEARCPSNNYFCFGCRGLIDNPNAQEATAVMKRYGLYQDEILKKYRLFYGYWQEITK